MNVAGKTHSQKSILGIDHKLDLDHFYQDQLVEFADNHGWTRGMVCYWWSQIALARMKHGRQDQEVAEDAALHDVFAAFRDLKIGNQEPD